MITLKFSSNGHQVEATTDSASDVMAILASMTPAAPMKKTRNRRTKAEMQKARAAMKETVKTQVRPKSRAASAMKPWTREEVQALFDHRMLKPRFLTKVPALQGRSKIAIATYARFIKSPARISSAPMHFRNLVAEVSGRPVAAMGPTPHTGLLDD